MYKALHKEGQKKVYNDAKARLVQVAQDTQEVFDGKTRISPHDFAQDDISE